MFAIFGVVYFNVPAKRFLIVYFYIQNGHVSFIFPENAGNFVQLRCIRTRVRLSFYFGIISETYVAYHSL